jgi:hypothetical protein
LLKPRIPSTAAIGLAAALASFLPTAAFNWKYGGDWTGLGVEKTILGTGKDGDTALRLSYNCLVLFTENLAPPIFPMAPKWNDAVLHAIPPAMNQRLLNIFEPSQAHLYLGELEIEEAAGLGLGVTMLLIVGVTAGVFHRFRRSPVGHRADAGNLFSLAIMLCAWVSLAAFLAKSGWATAARLITPYYALVAPLLLVGDAQSLLVRSRWWRNAALLVFALAGAVVVLSPPRPLWPAQTTLARLERKWPDSRWVARAKAVYSVYAQRSDAFAPVRRFLPASATVVGVVTFDDPETSLWRPFGARRFEHVLHTDSREDLRLRGIGYIVINSEKFHRMFDLPFNAWLSAVGGEIVRAIPLRLRAGDPPVDWIIVKLSDATVERPGSSK